MKTFKISVGGLSVTDYQFNFSKGKTEWVEISGKRRW